MNQPLLKEVPKDDAPEWAGHLADDMVAAVAQRLFPAAPLDPASMVHQAGETLREAMDGFRKVEAQLENDKAAALHNYEAIVRHATTERDAALAQSDQALRQVRHAMAALEPARASIAEFI